MAKLTDKQKMFCKEYIVDLNATQAAIRADYSVKTAQVIGSENLSKPLIQAEIQRLMSERAHRVEITADNVLQDILDTRVQCENNMTYWDAQGNKRLDASAVNGRSKSNELLGRHIKLFTDKVELSVTEMPEIVFKRHE